MTMTRKHKVFVLSWAAAMAITAALWAAPSGTSQMTALGGGAPATGSGSSSSGDIPNSIDSATDFTAPFPGAHVSLPEAKRIVTYAIAGHIPFHTASLVVFGNYTFNGALPEPSAPASSSGFQPDDPEELAIDLPQTYLRQLQTFRAMPPTQAY